MYIASKRAVMPEGATPVSPAIGWMTGPRLVSLVTHVNAIQRRGGFPHPPAIVPFTHPTVAERHASARPHPIVGEGSHIRPPSFQLHAHVGLLNHTRERNPA